MAKAGLLFVGTGDGLVLFSNPNEIGRWLRIGQPFRGQAVPAVWARPDNPLAVLASVEGLGVQRSEDGGQSWSALFEQPAAIVGGQQTPGLVYLRAGSTLFASQDGGASWDERALAAEQVGGALAVAPADARRLYAADGAQVLISQDGGQSWGRFGEPLPATIDALAAAPQNALYAAAGGGLHVAAGDGGTWQQLAAAPATHGPIATLSGKQPALLLAAADGGIARSEDFGASWSAVLPEGQLDVIVPASYHIDVVFAGSQAGQLFTSTDRGRSWQVVKQDLPPITSIAAARLL